MKVVALNNWLRKKVPGILELAWLDKVPPEILFDHRKGQRKIVTIDVTGGGKIWLVSAEGALSEMKGTAKPRNGKVQIEVSEGETIFLAKSLKDAVKHVHGLMR
jgi:hypothetical protein